MAEVEAVQRKEFKEFVIDLFRTNYAESAILSPSKAVIDSKLMAMSSPKLAEEATADTAEDMAVNSKR